MDTSQFTIDDWIRRFPLDEMRKDKPFGASVSSPRDLAIQEQLRREAAQAADLGRAFPMTVFLYGLGESADPMSTKIGGLPYRPKDKPWPRSQSDNPLTFIGQICLHGMRDLVGELPGDVLLFFAEDDMAVDTAVEWYSGDLDDLVGLDEIPETELKLAPLFGVHYRTNDFPYARERFRVSERQLIPFVDVYLGTKIGGIPALIQPGAIEEIDAYDPDQLVEWALRGPFGRYIGTLGSVHVQLNHPFPFVNVEYAEPQGITDLQLWILADVGAVHFFVNEKLETNIWVESF